MLLRTLFGLLWPNHIVVRKIYDIVGANCNINITHLEMHREKYCNVYILYRTQKAKEYVPNETFLPRLYEEPPKAEAPCYKTF